MALPPKIFTTICGFSELDRYTAHGVTHVLSILDPYSPEPDIFKAYQPHFRTTLHFHDEIDSGPSIVLPHIEHIETILALGRSLADDVGEGRERHILVHCHMGVSRSTAAMAVLLAVVHPDDDEDRIFAHLLQLRLEAWPNCLMVELADDLLGRGGRLVAALGRLYGVQLANRPEMGPYLRKHGRGREVNMAAIHNPRNEATSNLVRP
jgi:predicted protein tyrosine phosphatase